MFYANSQYFPKYMVDLIQQPLKIQNILEESICEMGKKTIFKKLNDKYNRINMDQFQQFLLENYFKRKL